MTRKRKSPLEGRIVSNILLEIGKRPDVRIWRCNVAPVVNPRTGKIVGKGLPHGHPDIAGVLCISGIGISFFCEVKTDVGRESDDQVSFGAMLLRFGSCYVVARSVDEAEKAIDDYRSKILLRLRDRTVLKRGPNDRS